MKKNDFAILAVIIIVSSLFAYILAGALIGGPKKRNLSTEVVDKIQATFPDVQSQEFTKFYNKDALNPTQVVTIGDGSNPSPFKK
jgi:hypothetical protein